MIHNNLQLLFSFRHLFPPLSGKAKRNEKRNSLPAKKQKVQDDTFLKNTFTREYCCLPSTDAKFTPNADEMLKLQEAGLGKKKVTFDVDDTHNIVYQRLTREIFPRLSDAGGFTLHKATSGGYSRTLVPIDLEWYNIKDLRIKSVCGNGILYAKPLQKDLDLSRLRPEEVGLWIFLVNYF